MGGAVIPAQLCNSRGDFSGTFPDFLNNSYRFPVHLIAPRDGFGNAVDLYRHALSQFPVISNEVVYFASGLSGA